jgi:hypothetical protein
LARKVLRHETLTLALDLRVVPGADHCDPITAAWVAPWIGRVMGGDLPDHHRECLGGHPETRTYHPGDQSARSSFVRSDNQHQRYGSAARNALEVL